MKIEGTAPTQGPDGRRFSAAKSAPPKEGGKSFGALLKKAGEGKPVPASDSAPASAPAQTLSTPAPAPVEMKTPGAAGESADAPESFASHMDMVKLRLKSGYYHNTNIDDALSEKLTGYFDDLA
ncbi:MAG: hypothetical protein ABIW76_03875 [Fibrobacteria bacterium]